jgi:hypothetical protein
MAKLTVKEMEALREADHGKKLARMEACSAPCVLALAAYRCISIGATASKAR